MVGNAEYILHTEFAFDAAHSLEGYEGKCSQLHGHTWFVEVWIKGCATELQSNGILFDFGNVKTIKDKLDHKHLNKALPGMNPTAENLAHYIYDCLWLINSKLKYKVRLYETKVGKETWCEYGDF